MGCMDCIMGIVKYLVFLFNLIFALAGLALLIVGILFQIDFSDLTDAIDNGGIESFPILTIIIGVCIFVVAFFGCCGAIKENKCFLLTYSIILLVIFILQIVLGIFALVLISDEAKFRQEITDDLLSTLEDAKEKESTAVKAFDLLQETLECCGVNGPIDWITPPIVPIPTSCCTANSANCVITGNVYRTGCSVKLSNTLYDNIEIIGIVAIVLSATELAAAIFSLCLRNKVK